MDFATTKRDLGLGDEMESLRPRWKNSTATFDPAGAWLPTPEKITEYGRWLGFSAEITQALAEALTGLRRSPALVRLLWHYHDVLFGPDAQRSGPDVAWFELPATWGQPGRLFQALVILSGVPFYRACHQSRGIPEIITRGNLQDIARWMEHYRQQHGVWGHTHGNWLVNHIRGRLYELGRLQYGRCANDLQVVVLRKKAGPRRVLALAADGQKLRQDGRFHNAVGTDPADPGWITAFRSAGDKIVGHPVVAPNVFRREPMTLPAAEWEIVLRPGDPILDIHIPAAGPLKPALLDDSFAQALAFFPRYFPEHQFKAWTCSSWLMDPQFSQHVPGGNMAKFAERFHQAPAEKAGDFQMWERAFENRYALDQAPRDTKLRRALIAHMEQGGYWWYTGAYVLREEVNTDPTKHRRLPDGSGI